MVKRHQVADRRLAQGSMRQWSKECGSTKLNTETEAESKNQNRCVENGKSKVEENRRDSARRHDKIVFCRVYSSK